MGIFLVAREVCRLNREFATLRHRVPRVHREVHDDLINLTGIGLHCPNLGHRYHDELDVLPDHLSEHVEVSLHEDIQIHYLRSQHLFPAEGKQLSCKGSGTLARIGNFLD